MWVALFSGFAASLVAPAAVGRRWSAALLAAFPAAGAVLLAAHVVGGGDVPVTWSGAWLPGLDLTLSLRLDGLALLFGLVVCTVSAAVVLYAPAYLADHPHRGRFCSLLLLFQSVMMGLVLADDLLLLFCFWEATSVVSYLLVGFEGERKEARSAALRALLVTGMGGLALLGGLVLLGEAAGSYRISEVVTRSEIVQTDPRLPWIVVLILLGAFTKSAQVPFHFWLPGAMTAPTPASALLHAATMVKAGIYLLLRLTPILGGVVSWDRTLIVVGAVTTVYGGVVAMAQTNLKGLLAHTTISALGTLVLLIGLGERAALHAALAFLVAHALYKGAMFLTAGSVTHGTGEKTLERLGGLRRVMPWTATAAALAFLSMAGLPPTLGFVAKESVFRAASRAGVAPVAVTVAAVAAAAAVVAAAVVFFRGLFLGRPRDTAVHAHEGRAELALAPCVLALLALALGLGAVPLDAWLVAPALATIHPGPAPERLALWHGFDLALGLEAVALAVGLLLATRHGWLASLSPRLAPLALAGPARLYDRVLAGLLAAGRLAAAVWGRRLRTALLTVVLGALLLVGGPLLAGLSPSTAGAGPSPRAVELVIVALTVAGVVMAIASPWRLATVICLGVTGYGVAVTFTFLGAPDLAMTQFVVETLVVVLFVLAFHGLPAFRAGFSRRTWAIDASVAAAVGLMMAGCVLLALSTEIAPSESRFYVDKAPEAHGRNVVNLILSDFRALDTLGEITVLAIAGVGVAGLFHRLGRSP